MCGEHEEKPSSTVGATEKEEGKGEEGEWPGDWENMELPPDYILSHLTDAHCHPTDLEHDPSVYHNLKIGLAFMGTIVDDQEKVFDLGEKFPWASGSKDVDKTRIGPRVVSCFGYHPWFTYRYSLSPTSPSKAEHYTSIFFPPLSPPKPDNARRKREKHALEKLLPYFPDPIPFQPLLEGVRENILKTKKDGRLAMVGEVGLDGGARVIWPKSARHLYDEEKKGLKSDEALENNGSQSDQGGKESVSGNEESQQSIEAEKKTAMDLDQSEDEWKRLTPFKVSLTHQKAILRAQMELAIELGVPVSLHCVAVPGPTMEVLTSLRDQYGPRFTNRVNVDLHSAGGWSPDFWAQASKQLSNLYASPSIYITARHAHAPDLIRAVRTDRMLAESDTHDVRRSTRLVWGAAEWIARVKGWKLEGRDKQTDWEGNGVDGDHGDWVLKDTLQSEEEWVRKNTTKSKKGARKGEEDEEVWTVKTLERNWARFMGLIEPYE